MDSTHIEHDDLVDIRSVEINTSLSKEERIKDFLRQIKNPYVFKHGKYIVKIEFSDTDVSLEQRLADYIRAKCSA